MSVKIGFLINPIAGIGGKRAWKGTDDIEEAWEVFEEEEQYAYKRVQKALSSIPRSLPVLFYYCSDPMGKEIIEQYPFENELVYQFDKRYTTAEDTKEACKIFKERKVDLILFVGGDGTARDVLSVVGQDIPVLGIPSGVKMFSGCFLFHPTYLGEIIQLLYKDDIQLSFEDVLDVNEELFRSNKVAVTLYGQILTPQKTGLVQGGKIPTSADSEVEFSSIAEELREEYNITKGYVILGTGSTVYQVMRNFGIEKTLLGVDLMVDGEIKARDLDEDHLYSLVKDKEVKIVLSPIGGQGFLLGRGNQQISAKILEGAKDVELIVVATAGKIRTIKVLEIDLDKKIEIPQINNGFIKVITAYHQYKVRKVNMPN
ncbi:MAG: ATP-NAD kinase family protein [Candidatus Heimdallarchaeaceae archaeon]